MWKLTVEYESNAGMLDYSITQRVSFRAHYFKDISDIISMFNDFGNEKYRYIIENVKAGEEND